MQKRKFWTDSVANIFSLVFLGLSGLALNIIVPRLYGAATLGVFSQVFSLYVLISQLATWGIQYSVLRHIPGHENNSKETGAIIKSAVMAVLPFSLSAGVITALLAYPVGQLLDSPLVGTGLLIIAPAVTFFALNKVLLGVLNGLQKNQSFAFFTGLRYGLIFFCLISISFLHLSPEILPSIILISELIVTACLFPLLRPYISSSKPSSKDNGWQKIHRDFGIKAMWGGFATALNTRMDVLVIGLFLTDEKVGIYSIAAYIVEMTFQLSVAMRRVIDPILAKQVYAGHLAWIQTFIRKGRLLALATMIFILGVAILTYPIIIPWVTKDVIYMEGWHPFMVLSFGAVIMGAYWPFFGLLSQSGHPREQSRLVIYGLMANTLLNFLLVPILGLMGAALATALAYIMQAVYYRVTVFKLLKIKI